MTHDPTDDLDRSLLNLSEQETMAAIQAFRETIEMIEPCKKFALAKAHLEAKLRQIETSARERGFLRKE